MAKGYWIVHVTVTDQERYRQYLEADAVVLEFESYDQALACYRSPEYQAALPHRLAASRSEIVIVEGMDG